MERARTRGHPAALQALGSMVRAGLPHALLVVGPANVGKTTLALDLAAAGLCAAEDPAARPCRTCRPCHLVASGNHPDLHWLRPEGPGGQIRIGGSGDARTGPGVRDLIADLALLPMEGPRRVAIVEAAHRMNEDAQHAILKLLEEPPPGVTIVLCSDEDDRLLATVRSRVARLRLGPVATREIESLLADEGLADPPTAARLARLAHGRPGFAISLASAPDVVRTRDEVARLLLDLVGVGRRVRLERVRDLLRAALEMREGLSRFGDVLPVVVADVPADAAGVRPRTRGGGRGVRDALTGAPDDAPTVTPDVTGAEASAGSGDGGNERRAPVERRQAAQLLLETWREVARDLAVVVAGGRQELHDPARIDELTAASVGLRLTDMAAFLGHLEDTGRALESNANPELALDVLVLGWPRARAA